MKTKRHRDKKPQIHLIHGYRVVLIPVKIDTLHVECAINNGFISENRHTTGINHLLEHVLSESWKRCKNNCYRFMNDNGLKMNASTEMTIMKYYTSGLPVDVDIMINYIIDIMEIPIFSHKKIEREKKAVINELSAISNDPDTELIDVFNKHFYAVEGLQYADDVDRQIKRLSSINLQKLKKVFFDHYNRFNMLFVVCGKFNEKQVLELFRHKLVKYAGHDKVEPYCFSKKHDILFLKNESPKIMVGFPSVVAPSSELFVLIPSVVDIINTVLFEVLRTKHDLIYGIESECQNTICGTVVTISADVLQINIKPVLKLIMLVLHKFKKEFIPERFLTSDKKLQEYEFTTKSNNPADISDIVIEQMMQQIHIKNPIIYTRDQIQRKIQSLDVVTFKKIMNLIFDFNDCLIVYQCKSKVNISLSNVFLN
jgi:predicted Zn-dependent peptidase